MKYYLQALTMLKKLHNQINTIDIDYWHRWLR